MNAKPHLRLKLTLIDPDISGLRLQNTPNININVQGTRNVKLPIQFQLYVSAIPSLFHFVLGITYINCTGLHTFLRQAKAHCKGTVPSIAQLNMS